MKKPVTLREIFCFGLLLIASYFAIIKKWDSHTLREDKARAEERVKMLEAKDVIQHHLSDSLKANTVALKAVIEYQEKNPKLIIEKYDKIRDNARMLNADESVRLLSGRLSKESGN